MKYNLIRIQDGLYGIVTKTYSDKDLARKNLIANYKKYKKLLGDDVLESYLKDDEAFIKYKSYSSESSWQWKIEEVKYENSMAK